MIRTNKIIPTAILTSDWHLREDTPVCRTDDYWSTQWKKVRYISSLQMQYGCPVLHAGDLFDKWKPSPYLLSETIKNIPDRFHTIYGQHDLPEHNIELFYKCGINVLNLSGSLTLLAGTHFGQFPDLKKLSFQLENKEILLWHTMVYQGKLPWPGCTSPSAAKVLRTYPQFPLILMGDNHKSFVEEYKGRILVNPGSLMRMDADQIDFQPRVYLWYANTNTVKPVYLPIEENVVSREHIERKTQRDNRIDAFVSRLNTDWEGAIGFEENLERLITENKIKDNVKSIIYKALE